MDPDSRNLRTRSSSSSFSCSMRAHRSSSRTVACKPKRGGITFTGEHRYYELQQFRGWRARHGELPTSSRRFRMTPALRAPSRSRSRLSSAAASVANRSASGTFQRPTGSSTAQHRAQETGERQQGKGSPRALRSDPVASVQPPHPPARHFLGGASPHLRCRPQIRKFGLLGTALGLRTGGTLLCAVW